MTELQMERRWLVDVFLGKSNSGVKNISLGWRPCTLFVKRQLITSPALRYALRYHWQVLSSIDQGLRKHPSGQHRLVRLNSVRLPLPGRWTPGTTLANFLVQVPCCQKEASHDSVTMTCSPSIGLEVCSFVVWMLPHDKNIPTGYYGCCFTASAVQWERRMQHLKLRGHLVLAAI